MRTLAAGYEFGHRDDYEGRRVLPDIKVDSDSRNIEELEVEADPDRYRIRVAPERQKALEDAGFRFKDYEGLMEEMDAGSLVIDDLSHHEMEVLVRETKPDVFCAGIKEKYAVQKMGVPLKQLHSYDYGGPYAGFKGAINFYADIARMTGSRVWGLVGAPWEAPGGLKARFVNDERRSE